MGDREQFATMVARLVDRQVARAVAERTRELSARVQAAEARARGLEEALKGQAIRVLKDGTRCYCREPRAPLAGEPAHWHHCERARSALTTPPQGETAAPAPTNKE